MQSSPAVASAIDVSGSHGPVFAPGGGLGGAIGCGVSGGTGGSAGGGGGAGGSGMSAASGGDGDGGGDGDTPTAAQYLTTLVQLSSLTRLVASPARSPPHALSMYQLTRLLPSVESQSM